MKINKTLTAAGVVIITATLLSGAVVPMSVYADNSNVIQTAQSFSVTTNFKDVPSSHWASAAIQSAVSKGYFIGYKDGTFKPSAPVTKEEFAVLMSRVSINDLLGSASVPSDVKGRWSEEGIAQAMQKGFVDSTSIKNGKFNPQEKLSRMDMVRMMVRGLWQTNDDYRDAVLSTNDTVVPVAEFYKGGLNRSDYGYVSVALGTGLINGFSNGSFGGSQTTTRAEVAALLLRLESIQKKSPEQFSQLQELIEVGLEGTNASTMGFKPSTSGSGGKELGFGNIRGAAYDLIYDRATVKLENLIVVDTTKEDSLYYKMFVGNNFTPKHKESSYAVFTLVNVTPKVAIDDWQKQLSYHSNSLTSSSPYSGTGLINYGYPAIPRDISKYFKKGSAAKYWSYSSVQKSGGRISVGVGNNSLAIYTE